jgi:hypothetical protein
MNIILDLINLSCRSFYLSTKLIIVCLSLKEARNPHNAPTLGRYIPTSIGSDYSKVIDLL